MISVTKPPALEWDPVSHCAFFEDETFGLEYSEDFGYDKDGVYDLDPDLNHETDNSPTLLATDFDSHSLTDSFSTLERFDSTDIDFGGMEPMVPMDNAWLLASLLGHPYDGSPALTADTSEQSSLDPFSLDYSSSHPEAQPTYATPKKRRSSMPSKMHKATHACDLCIARKRRCDGSPPSSAQGYKGCSYCASHGAGCEFTREVKKRGPKKSEDSKKAEAGKRVRAKSFSAAGAKEKDAVIGIVKADTFFGTSSTTSFVVPQLPVPHVKFPGLPISQPQQQPHLYASYHPPPILDHSQWDPETGFYDEEDLEAFEEAAGGREEEGVGWLRVPWF
jgi:hypothetical protein